MKTVKHLVMLTILSAGAIAYGNDDITIKTKDGTELKVQSELAEFSDTIQKFIEEHGTNEPIPLSNVTSADWQYIESLLKLFPYHKVSYKGLDSWKVPSRAIRNDKDKNTSTSLQLFDDSFQSNKALGEQLSKLDNTKLINIINISSYWGMPLIYNYALSTLAGRTSEDITVFYGNGLSSRSIPNPNRISITEILQQITERSIRNQMLFNIAVSGLHIFKESETWKISYELKNKFLAMSSDQANKIALVLEDVRLKKIVPAEAAKIQIKQILNIK